MNSNELNWFTPAIFLATPLIPKTPSVYELSGTVIVLFSISTSVIGIFISPSVGVATCTPSSLSSIIPVASIGPLTKVVLPIGIGCL